MKSIKHLSGSPRETRWEKEQKRKYQDTENTPQSLRICSTTAPGSPPAVPLQGLQWTRQCCWAWRQQGATDAPAAQRASPLARPLWDGAQGPSLGHTTQLQIKTGRLCNGKYTAPSTPSHNLKNWGFLCQVEKKNQFYSNIKNPPLKPHTCPHEG